MTDASLADMFARSRAIRRISTLAVAAAVLAGGVAATVGPQPARAATNPVPAGFIGVTTSPPLLEPGFPLSRELGVMRRSGVESLRMPFNWAAMQPYRTAGEIPNELLGRLTLVDGIPTDFRATDRQIKAASAAGLTVLPFVIGTPFWSWSSGRAAPDSVASARAYAAFMGALVGRYGPQGTLWQEHPKIRKLPIRDWQIWNEPHIKGWWPSQPFAPAYVRLLRESRAVIKRADPSARIVLCGLSNRSWEELAKIYRAKGAGLFDAIAIHPYTLEPSNLVENARRVRAVSKAFGDSKRPIIVTEFGWPASKDAIGIKFGFETTVAGQVARIKQSLVLLAANRNALGIQRIYWETWMTEYISTDHPFDYAGLRWLKTSGAVDNTPAFFAFRTTALALEGCDLLPRLARCA